MLPVSAVAGTDRYSWRRGLGASVSLLLPLAIALIFFAAPGTTPRAAAAVPGIALPDSCRPGVELQNPTAPPEERVRSYTVVAAPLRREIQPGLTVPAWAYNGAVPAPEIRGVQDELLRVVLCNGLPAPVTIHWHGYPVPWTQDGVAGLTQNAVQPGEIYTYEFRLSKPGTYWYHSHQDSAGQVDRGLYGPFVVVPRTPNPETEVADVERNVVLADDAGNALWVGDDDIVQTAAPRRLLAPDRRVWTLNGRAYPHGEPLRVQAGQRVLLRVINAGLQTHRIKLGGHLYRLVAVDGQPINQPSLTGATIAVASGERYDLLFVADNPGAWSLRSVDDDERAAYMRLPIVYEGQPDAPGAADEGWQPQAAPIDLTIYGAPDPDRPGLLDNAGFNRVYHFELAKDNGYWAAHVDGAQVDGLAPWLDPGAGVVMRLQGAQGSAGGHHANSFSLRPDDVVQFAIVNNTESEHPVHIHGHFFQLLSLNGKPYSGSPIFRDTATVWPHDTLVVGFQADNPGAWMAHCHILWHAAMGMGITFDYEGVQTPYAPGGPYDNKPE